jgi:hypothetical protein
VRVEEQVEANGHDVSKIIASYKSEGRQPTLKEFKLTDSQLYTLLHREGVRLSTAGKRVKSHRTHAKARRADSRATRGVGKGSENARRRASYKARREAREGGGRDALVYLGKAAERLVSSYGAGYREAGAILGLVSLAIEALGGE